MYQRRQQAKTDIDMYLPYVNTWLWCMLLVKTFDWLVPSQVSAHPLSSIQGNVYIEDSGGLFADGSFSLPPRFWQPQKLSFMPSDPNGNIVIVADTQNNAIRVIDFASKTVSSLVSINNNPSNNPSNNLSNNLSNEGVCLNVSNSCGIGLKQTDPLLMPYAFAIHPYQKFVMVADTRNRALRQANLFNKETTIIASELEHEPLDMTWISPFQLVIVMSNNQLYTFQQTTLVSFNIDNAGMQQLVGITSDGLNTVYVSDYIGKVIYSIDLVTLQKSTVVSSLSGPLPGPLSGPTNLVYTRQKLYFSDRSVSTDTYAIRIWDMQSNQVNTLITKTTSIWGVSVGVMGVSQNHLVFSEIDTNSILSIELVENSNKTLCSIGFLSLVNGTCQSCDSSKKPSHVKFTTSETCQWNCSDYPMQQPFACHGLEIPNTRPGENNSFWAVELSNNTLLHVCKASYYKKTISSCNLCEPGHYCDGLDYGRIGTRACPPFSTSPEGSISINNCTCKPGYFGNPSSQQPGCQACTIGYYCTGNGQRIICPFNLTTSSTGKQKFQASSSHEYTR